MISNPKNMLRIQTQYWYADVLTKAILIEKDTQNWWILMDKPTNAINDELTNISSIRLKDTLCLRLGEIENF